MPPIPQFGVEPAEKTYSYGDTFIFECSEGYIVVGTQSITCGVDGSFGTARAACSPGDYYFD